MPYKIDSTQLLQVINKDLNIFCFLREVFFFSMINLLFFLTVLGQGRTRKNEFRTNDTKNWGTDPPSFGTGEKNGLGGSRNLMLGLAMLSRLHLLPHLPALGHLGNLVPLSPLPH